MKTLYLLRHAKSSWQHPGLNDIDRPLLEKGLFKIQLINDYLLAKQVKIDMIISSPAVRARQTAEIFANALGFPTDDIIIENKVYHGDTDDLLELFFHIPSQVDSLMIVGHNPTITSFANHFLNYNIDCLPTSGIACISFSTDKWENIALAKRKTNFVVYPKMFS
ncbi:MAG: histidine phosphatase family protein [Bacteroidales bacterium]|nr:histidine phosphatase family protein [Bacteroidales bacterium]MDZ4204302.1 histidine phosphatase family protein [Bacteroidales bacterium]